MRRRTPAKKPAAPAEPSAERRCWLCSELLTHGVMAPLLDLGSFEVHQRCYDRALKG